MKISVITIVFNDKNHIEETIVSVASQTARAQIEYIVVDGLSTDGTSDIIRKHIAEIDRYICERDTGIYNAMNKGLAAATGDYVIFANSGDKLSYNNTIESVIRMLEKHSPLVAYGNYRETDGNNFSTVIPCRHYSKIWYGMVASHQSILYSRKLIKDMGLSYDESYKIAADYKFTTEAILKAGDKIITMDICISDFDISGVSSVNQNLGLREANRVRQEVLGWGKPRILLISIALLGARYLKKYAGPIYRVMRGKK